MTDSDSGRADLDTHMTGTEAHDGNATGNSTSEPQSPPSTQTRRSKFKGWWIGIHPDSLGGQGPMRYTDPTASVNPAVSDGSTSAKTEDILEIGYDSQQETGCKLEEAPETCQVVTNSKTTAASSGKGGGKPYCDAFWT